MDSNSIAFIKIDTQGYETQVMNGAKKLMSQIVGLQVEISLVPLYKGQCLFDEMLKKLKNYGFELWSISTVFSDPNTGQLLQVDGVIVKSGVLCLRRALFKALTQKSSSRVTETSQDST